MVYIPRVRIEVYKGRLVGANRVFSDDTAIPDYVIDEFQNLQIQFGTDRKKDKISFNLVNHRELVNGSYQYSSPSLYDIKEKDLIKVYAWNEPMSGTLASNLILNGYVKSYSYNSEEAVGTFNFTCFNRTEVLMNSFMFADFNTGNTVPNMIVDRINKVKTYNSNDAVYAYKDYTGTASPGTKGAYDALNASVSGSRLGYIRAYKSGAYKTDGSGELKDGTGGEPNYTSTVPSEYLFPSKVFIETYKEIAKLLDTLTSEDYTEDTSVGKYLYWVDNSNNLHFEPKSFTTIKNGQQIILREREWSKVNMSKDTDEVINAVIINCGTDPNQIGITSLSYNASSMGKNGAKWKFLAKTGIAEEFRKNEAKSGILLINGVDVTPTDGDNPTNRIDADNYPESYPWIVQHSGSGDGWSYTAGTTTVTTDKQYRIYYRRICKQIGKIEGDNIVNYYSDPLWKGTWESDIGRNEYAQNEMVQIDVPSLELSAIAFKYPVRIDTITHTFSNIGWITTLTVKEDMDYRKVMQ